MPDLYFYRDLEAEAKSIKDAKDAEESEAAPVCIHRCVACRDASIICAWIT